jgi:hypothetical protein
VNTCNPSTREDEAGRSEFDSNLGKIVRSCLKKKRHFKLKKIKKLSFQYRLSLENAEHELCISKNKVE